MKIKLLHDGGYDGLAHLDFPIEVEARREEQERLDYAMYFVAFEELSKLEGWKYIFSDLDRGQEYSFFEQEVEVISGEDMKENKKVACLTIVGEEALFSCKDFVIAVVGEEHNITMKVPDPGGYKKVKAQHLVESIMTILKEDY